MVVHRRRRRDTDHRHLSDRVIANRDPDSSGRGLALQKRHHLGDRGVVDFHDHRLHTDASATPHSTETDLGTLHVKSNPATACSEPLAYVADLGNVNVAPRTWDDIVSRTDPDVDLGRKIRERTGRNRATGRGRVDRITCGL